ncbi:MAG TPA: hypothetical protein VFC44_03785 [Candidatus Saccharimonadales bacterium]|nr:hypothetical protein [Candidatus Saccharimonadales bacterium]
MQTKIEKVGDGFCLLLPKELLDACGFGVDVTVTLQDRTLIISPEPQKARQGWAEAIQAVSPAELDRDFYELESFRDAPDEWKTTGFTDRNGGRNETI